MIVDDVIFFVRRDGCEGHDDVLVVGERLLAVAVQSQGLLALVLHVHA